MIDTRLAADAVLCTARLAKVLDLQYSLVKLERDLALIGLAVWLILESTDPFATGQIYDGADGDWPKDRPNVPRNGVFVQFRPGTGTRPQLGLWIGQYSEHSALILLHRTAGEWAEMVRCWAISAHRFGSRTGDDERVHNDWSVTLLFLRSVMNGIVSPTDPA